jgi:hypothetical protein
MLMTTIRMHADALRPLRERIRAQCLAEACEQHPMEVLSFLLVEVVPLKFQAKVLKSHPAAIKAREAHEHIKHEVCDGGELEGQVREWPKI